MRAITHHRFGGPDVVGLEEIPRPVAGDDELLIRVEAAEVTKTDTEMRSARFPVQWYALPMRIALGVRRPRRPVLGMYLAGEVAEVGVEVHGFDVGDRVYGTTGLRRGGHAEYVALPAKALIASAPTRWSAAESAAMPLGAINGRHLVDEAEIGAGDRVLVTGAGGVIGAFAVQFAVDRGATVTGVDADHKADFVRRQGASDFHDYRRVEVTELPERFDAVIDMVPGSSVPAMLDLLVDGGRFVHGNPRLSTMVRAPWVNRRSSKRMSVAFANESRTALAELAALADEGRIAPIVDRVLPMEAAAEAHRLVDTEERVGAVVLRIGSD